jgi:hypothetical protein
LRGAPAFAPGNVADPLVYRDPKSENVLPFDAQTYARLLEGLIRE